MRYFPLYEAKMFHQFDHRWATFGGSEDPELTNLESYEPADLDEEEGEGGGDKAKTRDCTLAEKQDPRYLPTPRYWVSEADVLMRAVPLSREEKKELDKVSGEEVVRRLRPRAPKWLIAFRNITNTTNERSGIFSVLPLVGAGNSAPILTTGQGARHDLLFEAVLTSFVTDFCVRCKVGGTNFNAFYLEQIGVLAPEQISAEIGDRIVPLALELVYTSEHLRPLAEEVYRSMSWEVGKSGEPTNLATDQPTSLDPFPYDEDRRAGLRAELDALVARLYGLNRKQLRYILCPHGLSWAELEDVNDGREDPTCSGPHALPAEPALDFPGETFRVLKEKEEKRHGEYRTRRLVLEAWDRLWEELGPVEPLPVRFGGSEDRSIGLEVDRFVGPGQPTHPPTYQPTTLEPGRLFDVPVSTGLFADDSTSPEPTNTPTYRPADCQLVAPEPRPPTPLKDKEGRLIRVRVLGASGQEILAAGTVVGQRKQGDAVEWAVLVDETNAVRKFLSPPATLKRLMR